MLIAIKASKRLFIKGRIYIHLFILFTVSFVGFLSVWNFSIDDSFITYRFGQRLAEHGDLIWNRGALPVEGYTSFLSIIISAIFIKFSIDPLIGFKILSIILVFLSALAIYWSTDFYSKGESPFPALVFPTLFLLNPLTWFHSMSGMETALFTFLLILQCYLYLRLRFEDFNHYTVGLLSFLFFLSGLVRPEGAFWSFLVWIGLILALPNKRSMFLLGFIFFIVPGIIYFLWRWDYFNSLLPNTFYVKGSALLEGRAVSPRVILQLVAFFAGFFFLYSWFYVSSRKKQKASDAPFRTKTEMIILTTILCILYFSTTTMLMGYAMRFTYPFYQVLVVTFIAPIFFRIISLREISKEKTKGFFNQRLALNLSIATYFGLSAVAGFRTLPTLDSNNVNNSGYREIGKALESVAEKYPHTQLILYHHNMGELMYYAKSWNSIDAVGILDTHISRYGLTTDYVFDTQPDLLILPSKSDMAITIYGAEIYPDMSHLLVADKRFNIHYAYLGQVAKSISLPTMFFFISKKTVSVHPQIEGDLISMLNLKRRVYSIEP